MTMTRKFIRHALFRGRLKTKHISLPFIFLCFLSIFFIFLVNFSTMKIIISDRFFDIASVLASPFLQFIDYFLLYHFCSLFLSLFFFSPLRVIVVTVVLPITKKKTNHFFHETPHACFQNLYLSFSFESFFFFFSNFFLLFFPFSQAKRFQGYFASRTFHLHIISFFISCMMRNRFLHKSPGRGGV